MSDAQSQEWRFSLLPQHRNHSLSIFSTTQRNFLTILLCYTARRRRSDVQVKGFLNLCFFFQDSVFSFIRCDWGLVSMYVNSFQRQLECQGNKKCSLWDSCCLGNHCCFTCYCCQSSENWFSVVLRFSSSKFMLLNICSVCLFIPCNLSWKQWKFLETSQVYARIILILCWKLGL